MRGKSRFISLVIVTSMLVLTGMLMPTAAFAGGSIEVLLDGLSGPKGLALAPNGNVVVSQGAFSPPGSILEYVTRGADKGSAIELSPPIDTLELAIGSSGGWRIDMQLTVHNRPPGAEHGAPVADIGEYQQTDPDPFDLEGEPTESNPYGLAILPGGDALVADAAGNDLLRVTPDGDITTVARFDVEMVSTDHLPSEFGPFPPELPAESVPTAVALGPDGWVYVGELKGFPFRPGSSKVWRVNPNAEDAVCSVTTEDDDCSIAYEGFTGINDIDFHGSTLYVYEFAEDGLLAFEAGFETGEFPPAVLFEVKGNKITELARGKLSQPGGVVVRNRGQVYVTDGLFSDGRLVLVHR
jgi:hypothetical protein